MGPVQLHRKVSEPLRQGAGRIRSGRGVHGEGLGGVSGTRTTVGVGLLVRVRVPVIPAG
jgi:hypothetical protein